MGHSEDVFEKGERIRRISWKFRYRFNSKSAIELDIKRLWLSQMMAQVPHVTDTLEPLKNKENKKKFGNIWRNVALQRI